MTFEEARIYLKQEINIVDFIQANGLQLKRAGASSYKGICPFHNEKTPSFTVNEDYQNFKCFGCHASGDIFTYAMHAHTLDFGSAVRYLANERGIEIEDDGKGQERKDVHSVYKLLVDTYEYYRYEYSQLSDNHPAKVEVTKRGLDVNLPVFGYAPEGSRKLYEHLIGKGYTDEVIKLSELITYYDEKTRYDFFGGRLVIMLDDYMGRPVSFTSRKIFEDDKVKGKYVNGRDSVIFHKKSNLFGISRAKTSAREHKKIYVTEGQFDVLALNAIGIDNAVAASGTAFTNEHANILMRAVGEDGEIIFMFDGDDAGANAAYSVFANQQSLHMQAYAVQLKPGMDPCDYVVAQESEELIKLMDEALPLHDFVIDVIYSKLNQDKFEKMKFLIEGTKAAKQADSKFITEGMLNRISILSATPIKQVQEIFSNTKVNRYTPQTNETSSSEPVMLSPLVNIDTTSEADKLMITAIALLVMAPGVILKETPTSMPPKFKPFLNQVFRRYTDYTKRDIQWRFIQEDYDDKDFVTYLQNQNLIGDPKRDEAAMLRQYLFLYNKAMEMYKSEEANTRRAQAMSSVVNSTSADELAKALELYNKHNK